jgi:hypothetical protein
MASHSVFGAAEIAAKIGQKRDRVENEGDETGASAPRAKRRRAHTRVLKPRDGNIQVPDQLRICRVSPHFLPSCSDVPREFPYSESEITILKVIGSGDHSMVYRIAAGERTFVLKVVSIRTHYGRMSNQ